MKKAKYYIIESNCTWYMCKMSTDCVEISAGCKEDLITWASLFGLKPVRESNGITYLN